MNQGSVRTLRVVVGGCWLLAAGLRPPVVAMAQAGSGAPAAAQPAGAQAGTQKPPEAEGGYSYKPAGRRDPFVSLVARSTESRTDGKRPDGLPGLLVSEIALKGIMMSRGAFVAIVAGPDMKTYIVHGGERLYDGAIKTVTSDSIVCFQEVKDPLSLTKQLEVRKTLRVLEEVK